MCQQKTLHILTLTLEWPSASDDLELLTFNSLIKIEVSTVKVTNFSADLDPVTVFGLKIGYNMW